MSSRYCSTCGQPLSQGVAFCSSCGARILISTIPANGQQQGIKTRPSFFRQPVQPLENRRAPQQSGQRTILFAVIALVVMALTLYIVIVDRDLTALLIGLLIVFIIYALIRFSGPQRRVD